MKVKITAPIGLWEGKIGKVVAKVKVGRSIEYIIQVKNPTNWSAFTRNEFEVLGDK